MSQERPVVKYVIAGNYAQAQYWASQAGWSPVDWRYVSHAYDLRGLRDPVIVKCGTPWTLPYPVQDEINDCLAVLGVRARGIEEFLPILSNWQIDPLAGTGSTA